MAITLTAAYLAELKKKNKPNVVLEIALDSGTVKWGYSSGGFSDVAPILKTVASLQTKLDAKAGFASRGEITAVIVGRDNFKNLVRDEYLKNRRVIRKEGFTVSGYAWSDYAETFKGKIIDWSRKGDELTLVIADDMAAAAVKIPAENATKTQFIDYTSSGAGMNPVDIMTDILGASSEVTGTDSNIYTCVVDHVATTENKPVTGDDWGAYWRLGGSTGGTWTASTAYKARMNVPSDYIDSAQFTSERDLWLNSWLFSRVITEPKEAHKYLNELQRETNSFIVHDGEKISFKVFAPSVPGQTIEEWTDDYNIQAGSFSQKAGYKKHFFNRIVFYYDYDESGSDKEENFEAGVIAVDADSQGSGQWDEVKTKVIKSKWIRSITFDQPTNITGVTIYHAAVSNGAGSGTLTYNSAQQTLKWTCTHGHVGAEIDASHDGKLQLFCHSDDEREYIRVMVDTASLPGSNQSDTITITALNGSSYAAMIAQKLLSRYRDPSGPVSFDVDINNVAWSSTFIKPTDFKDITTDEAVEKGANTWSLKRCILTSVRPDFSSGKLRVEAIDANMYRRPAFIAPSGYPDYPGATAAQREYAYIGDGSNQVNAGTEEGFYII